MKKILALTAGMLLVASMAFAKDIDMGTLELSGSSNGFFATTSDDNNTVTVLNLGVEALYYVMPNFGVGGMFGYTLFGSDADGSDFTIGAEGLYNFPLADAVNAYAGVNLGYFSTDNGEATADGMFVGLAGGIKYFLTDAASLNTGLFYSHGFGDFEDDSFGVNVGLSIFIL